jgi:beta-phosphoglucomutase-like phosphatase (HAD superfamily)
LLTVFDPFVFSSEQVAQGKPAPDVFLFAAEQMGALQDRCLVVEDSEAGIRAAMAANMRVLGLVGHLPEDQIIALGAEPIQRMECISATLSS